MISAAAFRKVRIQVLKDRLEPHGFQHAQDCFAVDLGFHFACAPPICTPEGTPESYPDEMHEFNDGRGDINRPGEAA